MLNRFFLNQHFSVAQLNASSVVLSLLMEVCLLLTFVYKWFNSFVYRTCWVPSHIIFVNISFWILIEEEIFRLQSFEVALALSSFLEISELPIDPTR